jgi:hypothetical protein
MVALENATFLFEPSRCSTPCYPVGEYWMETYISYIGVPCNLGFSCSNRKLLAGKLGKHPTRFSPCHVHWITGLCQVRPRNWNCANLTSMDPCCTTMKPHKIGNSQKARPRSPNFNYPAPKLSNLIGSTLLGWVWQSEVCICYCIVLRSCAWEYHLGLSENWVPQFQ